MMLVVLRVMLADDDADLGGAEDDGVDDGADDGHHGVLPVA